MRGTDKMRRYRLIEHTADIGLWAYGRNLPEAFASAAYGMFAIMTDLRRVKETGSRRVELEKSDMEGLLFGWLNHLIYLFDTEGWLFRRFDIKKLTANRLVAECYGEKFDPSRHRLKLGVKSATYHLMNIDIKNNRIRVIFDV